MPPHFGGGTRNPSMHLTSVRCMQARKNISWAAYHPFLHNLHSGRLTATPWKIHPFLDGIIFPKNGQKLANSYLRVWLCTGVISVPVLLPMLRRRFFKVSHCNTGPSESSSPCDLTPVFISAIIRRKKKVMHSLTRGMPGDVDLFIEMQVFCSWKISGALVASTKCCTLFMTTRNKTTTTNSILSLSMSSILYFLLDLRKTLQINLQHVPLSKHLVEFFVSQMIILDVTNC